MYAHLIAGQQTGRQSCDRRCSREYRRYILNVLHDYDHFQASNVATVLAGFGVSILWSLVGREWTYSSNCNVHSANAFEQTYIGQHRQMVHGLCFKVQRSQQEYGAFGCFRRGDLLADGEQWRSPEFQVDGLL